jgi:hypothetical protein
LGGGGKDAVKNTNTNEIQILFAGYQKPAKLGKLVQTQSKALRCDKIIMEVSNRRRHPWESFLHFPAL